MPVVPRRRTASIGEWSLEEMDLDAVLSRRPELVLVDELAHTNAPWSRHLKRYQDVEELLAAGIDVHSTLNASSMSKVARRSCGDHWRSGAETLPDSVLDAAEIELVDLPPADLLQPAEEEQGVCVRSGHLRPRTTSSAKESTALRELALRLAAEQVGHDTQVLSRPSRRRGFWRTGQRLLVAVSASPSSRSPWCVGRGGAG